MLTRRRVVIGMCVWLAAAGGESAWATLENLKTFKQAYPSKEPKTYSCKICHQGFLGKKDNLNAYGLALQKLKASADAKTLTGDDLKAIEKEDSDDDGASNLDEINAGTAPGDPASMPQGVGAQAKPDEKSPKPPAPSPAAKQKGGT